MSRTIAIAFAAALATSACSSTTAVNTTQAISDAGIVVSGVSADYKAFIALYPKTLTAEQQATALAALTAAQTALAQLQSATTTVTGLQGVETNINAVLGVLSTACVAPICPASIAAGLVAANVLLPLIEVTINQLQGVPVTPKAAMAMSQMSMTPNAAREHLFLDAVGR